MRIHKASQEVSNKVKDSDGISITSVVITGFVTQLGIFDSCNSFALHTQLSFMKELA